jgi:hypothetical protein
VRPVFHPHLIAKATTTHAFTNYYRLPSVAQSPWRKGQLLTEPVLDLIDEVKQLDNSL